MNPEMRRAVLVGAGGGLRSFAPLAALAAGGAGPFPGPARFIAFGAAAGELIADKQPEMGSRWARRGLTLRLGVSTLAGRELAGAAGALIAAGTALATARAGSALRSRAPGGRGRIIAAAAEDVVAYALVIAATR